MVEKRSEKRVKWKIEGEKGVEDLDSQSRNFRFTVT